MLSSLSPLQFYIKTHTHTVEALQELILFLHKVHLYLSIYNVLICDWSIILLIKLFMVMLVNGSILLHNWLLLINHIT